MPVTLAQIAKNTATITISFGEDSLEIVYHPLLITDEMFVQLQSFAQADENAIAKFRDLSKMLVSIIASWDLLEEDGETVVPLTVERMLAISPVIKMLVIQAIISDIRPEVLAAQIPS